MGTPTEDGTGPHDEVGDRRPWLVELRRALVRADARSRPGTIAQLRDDLRGRRIAEIRMDIAGRLGNVLQHMTIDDAVALVQRMAVSKYDRERRVGGAPEVAE